MTLELRRSAERFASSAPGIESRHSLSFARHYDPERLRFGAIVACNEERVAPGAGFDEHGHRHVEIVTWVIEGVVEHRDETGRLARVAAGRAQYLAAGAGVRHSERNAARGPGGAEARFVQYWIESDGDLAAAYRVGEIAPRFGDLPVLVAASGGLYPEFDALPGAVTLRRPGLALRVARLGKGDTAAFPDAPRTHLLLTRGRVACDLGQGESVEAAAGDELKLVGQPPPTIRALAPAEVLCWELRASGPMR